MHMLITPMRRKGIALSTADRRVYKAIRGDVRVAAETCPGLGRSANVATVSFV